MLRGLGMVLWKCVLSEPLITLIFVMGCDLGCLLLGSVMDGVVLGRVWGLHSGSPHSCCFVVRWDSTSVLSNGYNSTDV